MSVLKILKYPNPRLKIKAKPVEKITDELRKTIADMFETMHQDNGGGLAATQVDVHLRIFTMDASGSGSKPEVFINPVILEKEGEIKEVEGCLSFPGVEVVVKRAKKIKVQAMDIDGNTFTRVYEDDYACRCVQHEIDHLDGIIFFDRLSPLKRKMVESKYRNSLKKKVK